jgi:DNA replication licensing factor MCM3
LSEFNGDYVSCNKCLERVANYHRKRKASLLEPPNTRTQEQEQGSSPVRPSAISEERIHQFRSALGQIIDGPLFANDAADVEPVVATVNTRLGAAPVCGRFEIEEAEKVLEVLTERGFIMYSDGVVHKT